MQMMLMNMVEIECYCFYVKIPFQYYRAVANCLPEVKLLMCDEQFQLSL